MLTAPSCMTFSRPSGHNSHFLPVTVASSFLSSQLKHDKDIRPYCDIMMVMMIMMIMMIIIIIQFVCIAPESIVLLSGVNVQIIAKMG